MFQVRRSFLIVKEKKKLSSIFTCRDDLGAIAPICRGTNDRMFDRRYGSESAYDAVYRGRGRRSRARGTVQKFMDVLHVTPAAADL